VKVLTKFVFEVENLLSLMVFELQNFNSTVILKPTDYLLVVSTNIYAQRNIVSEIVVNIYWMLSYYALSVENLERFI